MSAHPVIGWDGLIWTQTGGNYRLEQHAADGTPRKLIGVSLPERETPVMTVADAESLLVQRQRAGPIGTRTTSDENRPFLPARVFVQVDSTGLIWLMRLQRAPDADTIKVAYEYLSPDEAPEERSIPRNTEDRMYRTVVEVIDPSQGELIARHEIPFLGVLTAPGYVGRVRIDDSGHHVVKVYRLALTLTVPVCRQLRGNAGWGPHPCSARSAGADYVTIGKSGPNGTMTHPPRRTLLQNAAPPPDERGGWGLAHRPPPSRAQRRTGAVHSRASGCDSK